MTDSYNTSSKKINWCKKQEKGIKLTLPDNKRARDYLKTAEETLIISSFSKQIGSRVWQATHTYYFLYFCAYAILTSIGIKSEIHECTIHLIELLEKKQFIKTKLSRFLLTAKKLRIDNQYYLKNEAINIKEKKLKELLLQTEKYIRKINKKEKEEIKEYLNTL